MTLPSSYLPRLLYCLESGFPAELTAALLTLAEHDADDDDLEAAWLQAAAFAFVHSVRSSSRAWFVILVGRIARLGGDDFGCGFCTGCDSDCDSLHWANDLTTVREGMLCEKCLANYSRCSYCDVWTHEDDLTDVAAEVYCGDCREDRCTFCDDCDEWFRDDENHGHTPEACECEAPHLRFRFPADGQGTVRQDEGLTVELPKGTIDDEGIREIIGLLAETGPTYVGTQTARLLVDEVGPVWQMKRGNFTRRLSSVFYKKMAAKLPPELISEIGNVARAHSTSAASWHVEFTRDLNQPAEAFVNSESCWWSDNENYGRSRCAFKSWGGIGLRSWASADDDFANGRVWVQPLNADLNPTHEVVGAHAYVIYNAYGTLEGYVGARIVAHLAGRTYRKISFTASPQYVNNSTGYLVADEATCEATESLVIHYDQHDRQDADEIHDNARSAA